jgi:hypothetical protein
MNKMDIYCASILPKEERTDKTNSTPSTRYGKRCENIIARLVQLNYEDKYDVRPTTTYEMYHRIDKPYMTATLDGIAVEKLTKKKFIVEIKTHEVQDTADFEAWKSGNIPTNYLIQCCHYLAVLNDFDGAILVAKLRWIDYDTGLPRTAKKGMAEAIYYYRIDRVDYEKDIAYLETVETDFEENHIIPRIPPSIDLEILNSKGETNGERN